MVAPESEIDGEDRSVLMRATEPPDDTWRYGPLTEHVADVYLPEGADTKLAVVLIHGGYWRPEYDRVHLRPLASHLAEIGYHVISLEYRRIPVDPDATVRDLDLAIRLLPIQLAAHGVVDFVLVGHSAGGHLALVEAHRAGTPGLAGCVALAPVADLALAEALALDGDAVVAFLGGPAATRPDLDPAQLGPPPVPATVLHGRLDTLVPLAVSDAYQKASGVPLAIIENCAHFELIDPASHAMKEVRDAIDQLSSNSGNSAV